MMNRLWVAESRLLSAETGDVRAATDVQDAAAHSGVREVRMRIAGIVLRFLSLTVIFPQHGTIRG
jgi:hypothetical protein